MTQTPDGALLFTEDGNGTLWRVSFDGKVKGRARCPLPVYGGEGRGSGRWSSTEPIGRARPRAALRAGPDRAGPRGGRRAPGVDRPYGVAFYPPGPNPRYVYVATHEFVLRYPYQSGEFKPSGAAETIARLPAGAGHWTRDLAFLPDGATLYVAIGSQTNDAEGKRPPPRAEAEALEKTEGLGLSAEPGRALVAAFDPEGKNRRVYASGLRNCSGVTIRPGSDELWCVVNERDMLGDNLPPDHAMRIVPGAFYGWPWYYIGTDEDPRHKGERPD